MSDVNHSYSMRSSFRMPPTPGGPAAFSSFDTFGAPFVSNRSRYPLRRSRSSMGSSSSSSSSGGRSDHEILDISEDDDLEVVFQRSRRQRIYEERGGPPRINARSAQYNGYLTRDYYCIHDYRQSPWGTMLREGEYREPHTKAAVDFRRRFRVPADIFHKMVEMCDQKNVFECAGRDAAARIGVPIEMKLLACLRVLGRGAVFDDIEELSGMSKSTAHRSFKAFIRNFSHHFYAEYVYAPEGEALQQVMDVYSRLGFDGAIGSTDCVHVKMDQCPGDLYWRCKGKEGYPTLVYSVVVDHAHRIMHSTKSFWGARNDRTISKYDDYLVNLHTGVYPRSAVNYVLLRKDGTEVNMSSPYLLCDGGYHKWGTMMCPFGLTSQREQRLWGEGVESGRKDSECTFGGMKARFRSLRYGVRLHSPHEIDSMWFTCCILHNMLLMHDGFASALNTQDAWEALDPEDDGGRARLQMARADEIPSIRRVTPAAPAAPVAPRFPALEIYNSMLVRQASMPLEPDTPLRLLAQNTQRPIVGVPNGEHHEIIDVFEEESEPAFFALRHQLIEHYAVRWGRGSLQWPRAQIDIAQARVLASQSARTVSFLVAEDQYIEQVDIQDNLEQSAMATAATLTPPANFML
jgi:hypothetical protein